MSCSDNFKSGHAMSTSAIYSLLHCSADLDHACPILAENNKPKEKNKEQKTGRGEGRGSSSSSKDDSNAFYKAFHEKRKEEEQSAWQWSRKGVSVSLEKFSLAVCFRMMIQVESEQESRNSREFVERFASGLLPW